jgi:mRNA interferase RelE/StbE
VSAYKVYVTPDAFQEIKSLPGYVRHRIRHVISDLANAPRLAQSKELSLHDVEKEVRRLRLDKWRVLYAVSEEEMTVDVIAVRKRPPYDYGDLEALLGDIA